MWSVRHNTSRCDGSDTLHSAGIMQIYTVYAKDTKMAPGRGCAATSALKESQRHHNAHKRAQTRQCHESLVTPLPPEQRSGVTIVHVLVITEFVFGRAMKVDLPVEHLRAAVAMPGVDNRSWFATLKTLFDHLVGVRIHGAAGASWTNIAHLRV